MTKKQAQFLISHSRGIPFEELTALDNLDINIVLELLDYQSFFMLLDKEVSKNKNIILEGLKDYQFVKQKNGAWAITNLGAILFARDINKFPDLNGRTVIVRNFASTNNRELDVEQKGTFGYAAGFEGLIGYIMNHTQNRNY